MAKAKRTIDKEIKSKVDQHKIFSAKVTERLSDAFWVNRTFGRSLFNLHGANPFTFVITIVINPTITIKSVNVNGVNAKQEDFEIDNGNIICKIEALVSIFTFPLMIEAEGEEVDATTTFNMTCDGKKVFGKDQEITISTSGRGGYNNQEVSLP